MNNNGMNFDPQTGQPINNISNVPQFSNDNVNNLNNYNQANPTTQQVVNNAQNINPAPNQPVVNTDVVNTQQQPVNVSVNNQPNMGSQPVQVAGGSNNISNIPTIEQSNQSFVANTQAVSMEKTEEKKKGINYLFVIILFIIVLVSIFVLFPLLKNIF